MDGKEHRCPNSKCSDLGLPEVPPLVSGLSGISASKYSVLKNQDLYPSLWEPILLQGLLGLRRSS